MDHSDHELAGTVDTEGVVDSTGGVHTCHSECVVDVTMTGVLVHDVVVVTTTLEVVSFTVVPVHGTHE